MRKVLKLRPCDSVHDFFSLHGMELFWRHASITSWESCRGAWYCALVTAGIAGVGAAFACRHCRGGSGCMQGTRDTVRLPPSRRGQGQRGALQGLHSPSPCLASRCSNSLFIQAKSALDDRDAGVQHPLEPNPPQPGLIGTRSLGAVSSTWCELPVAP